MARQPKPWYRADRDSYYVTIGGVRHKLGPDKKAAMTRFYELMNQPKAAQVASDAFVAIADCFLEWVQKNRAADTYEWYRYRLEQFANRCSGLRAADVRPYHVQQWVDSYSHLSQNSRRNLVRSVKRCLTWARQQGYIVENPIRDIEMPGQQSREVCFTVEQFEEMCSFIRDRTFLELCRVRGKH